jgi:hypothetical protein
VAALAVVLGWPAPAHASYKYNDAGDMTSSRNQNGLVTTT